MPQGDSNVALSWRQVIAILFILACICLAIAILSTKEERAPQWTTYRFYLWTGFGISASLSVVFFAWHIIYVRQADIHPDILAQIFGENNVFEMHSLHFWAMGRQMGGRARVVILLQNVYSSECTGSLNLIPIGTTTKIPNASAPLHFVLGAAEVLAYWRDLPVPVTGEISFSFDGFIRKVTGSRIRFKRRTVIRSEHAANALTAVALLGGHIHVSNGSRLNIKLQSPPPDALTTISPGPWEALLVWSPEEPRNPQAIHVLLSQVIDG